jgi:hypothetical protein
MEPQNIYTYRQSELPPMTLETKLEIADIGFNVANLIEKIQGNYHALSYLVETLANSLNSAESNLCSIRIVPDGNDNKPLPRAIGLTDLPVLEKRMIISNAITGTVAIQTVATTMGWTFEQAADYVQTLGEKHVSKIPPDRLEKIIKSLSDSLHSVPDAESFTIDLEI